MGPKKTPETKTYLLRDVPAALWLAVRHLALDEKISMRDALIRLMEHAEKHGLPKAGGK